MSPDALDPVESHRPIYVTQAVPPLDDDPEDDRWAVVSVGVDVVVHETREKALAAGERLARDLGRPGVEVHQPGGRGDFDSFAPNDAYWAEERFHGGANDACALGGRR